LNVFLFRKARHSSKQKPLGDHKTHTDQDMPNNKHAHMNMKNNIFSSVQAFDSKCRETIFAPFLSGADTPRRSQRTTTKTPSRPEVEFGGTSSQIQWHVR
jgi:hypothetical protein